MYLCYFYFVLDNTDLASQAIQGRPMAPLGCTYLLPTLYAQIRHEFMGSLIKSNHFTKCLQFEIRVESIGTTLTQSLPFRVGTRAML